MRLCRFCFLGFKPVKEDAAAGAHGGGAAAAVDTEQVENGGELGGIVVG